MHCPKWHIPAVKRIKKQLQLQHNIPWIRTSTTTTTTNINTHLIPFLDARNLLLQHRNDIQTARATFQWPTLSPHFNWATTYFSNHLASSHGPTNPALIVYDLRTNPFSIQQWSFKQLDDLASQCSSHLHQHYGFQPGDRVAVLLGNRVEQWIMTLAAIRSGWVILPCTLLLSKRDIADRLLRGEVDHIVCEPHLLTTLVHEQINNKRLRNVIPAESIIPSPATTLTTTPQVVQGEMDLFHYFTSGTTSLPKCVRHSNRSYPVGSLSTMYALGVMPHDIHLNLSSPGWAKHAWSSLFAPWNAQATVLALQYDRFNPSQLLDVLSLANVTTFCAPPTVWRALVTLDLTKWHVPKLREICSAGEPLNAHIVHVVEKAWNLSIRDFYGLTETTAQIGNTPGQIIQAGSMGQVLPGYDKHVYVNKDTNELMIRTPGQVMGVMKGYKDKPETAGMEHIGFGDVVVGNKTTNEFMFVGRTDDVFKSSDFKVSPFVLESALIEVPCVVEAAVIPSPDEKRLTVPKAFVVLRDGIPKTVDTARTILTAVASTVNSFIRVRRIEFVDDLPKTISGKIRRVELRAQENQWRVTHADKRRDYEFWEGD